MRSLLSSYDSSLTNLTSPQCFLAISSRRDFNKLTLSFDRPLAFFNSISGTLEKKKIKRNYSRKNGLFALIFAKFQALGLQIPHRPHLWTSLSPSNTSSLSKGFQLHPSNSVDTVLDMESPAACGAEDSWPAVSVGCGVPCSLRWPDSLGLHPGISPTPVSDFSFTVWIKFPTSTPIYYFKKNHSSSVSDLSNNFTMHSLVRSCSTLARPQHQSTQLQQLTRWSPSASCLSVCSSIKQHENNEGRQSHGGWSSIPMTHCVLVTDCKWGGNAHWPVHRSGGAHSANSAYSKDTSLTLLFIPVQPTQMQHLPLKERTQPALRFPFIPNY